MVFERDPVNLLRLFWSPTSTAWNSTPTPASWSPARSSLIDQQVRRDAEANRLFLDILTSDRDPELILRRMNEAGVLGGFIPEFGRIVAMMQFNMYHHYTVDEHLLRAVGVLSEIERGDGEKTHPLSHTLMPGIDKHARCSTSRCCCTTSPRAGRRIIRWPAPGRAHALPASRACRRSRDRDGRLAGRESPGDVDDAQTRDLNDRKTIGDFAAVVQRPSG